MPRNFPAICVMAQWCPVDKLREESITLYILSVYRFFTTLRHKWLGSIQNNKNVRSVEYNIGLKKYRH